MKNYIELKSSLFYCNFAYFDIKSYYADSIFTENQVPVKYIREMHKEGTEYVVIFCKVKKKYRTLFLDCLEKLDRKMIICGNSDYEMFCSDWLTKAVPTEYLERLY